MSIRISSAQVKVWLFCLCFLPLTLKLAFWQLDRAAEKTALLERVSAAKELPLAVWDGMPDDGSSFLARPYELSGYYQDKHFLLDNKVRHGRAGYEVLSSFLSLSGEVVLVNRGWLPAERYRSELPSIVTPSGLVRILGEFYQSAGQGMMLQPQQISGIWPLRIQQIDWPLIETALGRQVEIEHTLRLLDDAQPGAYQTGWPLTSILPEKHMGYAYQWFALSVTLVLLSLWASYKLKPPTKKIKTTT